MCPELSNPCVQVSLLHGQVVPGNVPGLVPVSFNKQTYYMDSFKSVTFATKTCDIKLIQNLNLFLNFTAALPHTSNEDFLEGM